MSKHILKWFPNVLMIIRMKNKFSSQLLSLYWEENSCVQLKSCNHKANKCMKVWSLTSQYQFFLLQLQWLKWPWPSFVPWNAEEGAGTIWVFLWNVYETPALTSVSWTSPLAWNPKLPLWVDLACYYYTIKFSDVIFPHSLQASPA